MKKPKEKLVEAAEGKMDSPVSEIAEPAPLAIDAVVKTEKADEVKKLKKGDAEELEKQESIIERNRVGEWEVVKALRVIHARRLYRGTHRNFHEYCLARWDFDRAHADRLIKASEVYEDLKCLQVGDKPLIVTEAQLRPLTRIPTDNRVEAWQRAVELAGQGRVTMKIAEEAAAKFLLAKPVKEKPACEAEVVVAPAELPAGNCAEPALDRKKLQGLVKRLREALVDCQESLVSQAVNEIALYIGLTELDTDAVEKH